MKLDSITRKDDGAFTSPPFSSWYICNGIFKDKINFEYLWSKNNERQCKGGDNE